MPRQLNGITCEQYLGFSVADPRDINIWLSGYYAGKRGSAILNPDALRKLPKT